MSGLTPTQQIIASGSAAGPGSFAGQEWLVALNLGGSTAMFLIGSLFVADLIGHLWRNRRRDKFNHPVTVFRTSLLLITAGIVLRNGASAAVLWKWNPADPVGTSVALTLQRFIDPTAMTSQALGLGLILVSAASLVNQLRRKEWDVPIWQSLPLLKRPAILTVASFVAAAGVVMTR